MSDQPTQTPAAAEPNSTPAAAEPTPTPPGLRRGQLVSYAVFDVADNEHTATGVVVDVFDVLSVVDKVDEDGVVHKVDVHTTHARVAHLPAPLAISVAALTALS